MSTPLSRSAAPRIQLKPTYAAAALDLVSTTFALNDEQLAELLRATTADLTRWRRTGVPTERSREVDDLSQLATRLQGTLSDGMVPRVVRAPYPGGGGWSVLDAIAAGHHEAALALVAPLGDYVMDADPAGVRQQESAAMRQVIDDLLADQPRPTA